MSHLKEGQKAPDFQLGGRALKDFAGKKVILYFYPKDNTSGCTAQACNLRDNFSELKKQGFDVIGVSPDSEKSHTGFRSKHELPFELIADTEKQLMKAYGAWGEKKMYGKSYEGVLRTTFIIDEKGTIIKIFRKVDTKNHTEQILKELNQG
jgi:thioredoxin-dependent peroxiredoxin